LSRRTLRGAIPTTDSVLASAADGAVTSGPSVFRPAPGEQPPAARAAGPVDSDAILLRGPEAARARRLDLVGDEDLAGLTAVGPWAEQLDDAREAARSSGFQQGRQEGLAAGLQAARDQVERERAELGQLVERTIDGLQASCGELGQQLADRITELAIDVARAVLDREISVTDDPGAEAIARCLDMVPDRGCLGVRLHPGDAARLGEVPGLGDRELVITTDPALSPGDAVVTVDQITIDARISESLRRIEEALR
jgi:flagellar assembly protein FliH